MNLEDVYWITCADQKDGLQVVARDVGPFRLIRGERMPPKPVVFDRDMGKRLFDVIRTVHQGLFLVSDYFVEVLQRGRFTGWVTYPVEVYGPRDRRIMGYSGLSVTGRCDTIDHSRCRRTLSDPPSYPEEWSVGPPKVQPRRFPIWLGLYFDPTTWDGSHLFVPEASAFQLTTRVVKDSLQAAEITNVCFKRICDIEFVPDE